MKRVIWKVGRAEIRNIIAVVYITLVLLFIYVLAFRPVPEQNKDLINVLGGVVIGGVGTILSYFFGSSKNETDAAKNDVTQVTAQTTTTP
jgi:hypothetical protein